MARSHEEELCLPLDSSDEGDEFKGGRPAEFVLFRFAPGFELAKSIGEAQRGLSGDVTYGFWRTLLAYCDLATDTRIQAVGPSGLDDDAPSVLVARVGDRILTASVARGVIRWAEPEIRHQPLIASKAPQIAELDHEDGGGDEVQVAQVDPSLNNPLQSPVLAPFVQGLIERVKALVGVRRGLTILIESDLLGGAHERDGGRFSLVGLGPRRFTLISTFIGNPYRVDLQSDAQPCGAGIRSSASEITDSIIALIGHHDAHNPTCARLPSVQLCIEPIRDVGGRDRLTSPSLRAQVVRPAVAAEAYFEHDHRVTALGATHECLAQRRWLRRHRTDKAQRATPGFGHCHRIRVVMNVQPNIASGGLVHGLSLAGLGTSNPYGFVHVRRRPQRRDLRYRGHTSSIHYQVRPPGLKPWARP